MKVSPRLVNKDTPEAPSKTLRRFEREPKLDQRFHYRRIIGKLNVLENGIRTDLSFAVRQCARFRDDPRVSHCQSVEHIVKCLKNTKNEGMKLDPDDDSFKVYVDSDFCG